MEKLAAEGERRGLGKLQGDLHHRRRVSDESSREGRRKGPGDAVDRGSGIQEEAFGRRDQGHRGSRDRVFRLAVVARSGGEASAVHGPVGEHEPAANLSRGSQLFKSTSIPADRHV